MAVESEADRLLYLSVSDYGVTGLFNGTISVTGIFDDKFLMVDDIGVNIESSEPEFECRTSDVAAVTDGMTCVINSVNYVVTTLEADGTGMTVIKLHLA